MSMKRLRRARRHLPTKERIARITGDSPRQKYKKQARRKRLGPVQSKKGYHGKYVDVSDIERRTTQKAGGEHPAAAIRRREKEEALARAHAKRIGSTGGGSGVDYPSPLEASQATAALNKEFDLTQRRMHGKKSFRGHRQ